MNAAQIQALADKVNQTLVNAAKLRLEVLGIKKEAIKVDLLLPLIEEERKSHIDEAMKDASDALGIGNASLATITFQATFAKAGIQAANRYFLALKTAKKEAMLSPSGV